MGDSGANAYVVPELDLPIDYTDNNVVPGSPVQHAHDEDCATASDLQE